MLHDYYDCYVLTAMYRYCTTLKVRLTERERKREPGKCSVSKAYSMATMNLYKGHDAIEISDVLLYVPHRIPMYQPFRIVTCRIVRYPMWIGLLYHQRSVTKQVIFVSWIFFYLTCLLFQMFEADMLEYQFKILLYSRAKDKSSCCCDQFLGIEMSSWEKKTRSDSF